MATFEINSTKCFCNTKVAGPAWQKFSPAKIFSSMLVKNISD